MNHLRDNSKDSTKQPPKREDHEKNDYYATDPLALRDLLTFLKPNRLVNVWEPACGGGHLVSVLKDFGCFGYASDLIERPLAPCCTEKDNDPLYFEYDIDFLQQKEAWEGDILTNPPYRVALDFVKKGLELVLEGNFVIMFLKLTFLEGQERNEFFQINPPAAIMVHSSRVLCAKNGDFAKYNETTSTTAYAWFIWKKGYKENTVVGWLP